MTQFGVVGLLFALAGCAIPPHSLNSLPAGYALGAGPEAVVIGRVTLDLDPKPLEFFDKLNEISVMVQNGATREKFEIVCDQPGSDSDFFVALPPGEYALSEIVKGNLISPIVGRFTVPQAGVTYLGTLKFSNEGIVSSLAASMISGHTSIPGRWAVEDDYPASVATLGSRYPQITQPVAKSLVFLY